MHAHFDHIGRLPEILRTPGVLPRSAHGAVGFRGEIITTEATAFLLGPMLKEALSDLGKGDIAGKFCLPLAKYMICDRGLRCMMI